MELLTSRYKRNKHRPSGPMRQLSILHTYSEPGFSRRSYIVANSIGILALLRSWVQRLSSSSHIRFVSVVWLKSQSLITTRLVMSPASEYCTYSAADPKHPDPRCQDLIQLPVLVVSGKASSNWPVLVRSSILPSISLWAVFASSSHAQVRSRAVLSTSSSTCRSTRRLMARRRDADAPMRSLSLFIFFLNAFLFFSSSSSPSSSPAYLSSLNPSAHSCSCFWKLRRASEARVAQSSKSSSSITPRSDSSNRTCGSC
jgi:hypothetical protein